MSSSLVYLTTHHIIGLKRPFVLNAFDVTFLIFFASGNRFVRFLDTLSFLWNRVHVLLRSACLERRLSPLEVTSVVFGTDQGEDDDVDGNRTDEDALNEGVVWHVFWAIRSLDCRA